MYNFLSSGYKEEKSWEKSKNPLSNEAKHAHRVNKRKISGISGWREFDFEDPNFGNLKIQLSDDVLRAHKDVLCANSCFFDAMFKSGMKESNANEISLEDSEEEFTLFWRLYMASVSQ